MTPLIDFLLARIAEDEAVATAARDKPGPYGWHPSGWDEMVQLATDEGASEASMALVERFDPARVLAECEAKRRIIERISDVVWVGSRAPRDVVLELLALPYADHPDYDESWRP